MSKNGKDADDDDPDAEKILVIQKPNNFREAYLNCSKKTQLFINFFINEIGF